MQSNLPSTLKALRTAAKLTQSEFAEKVGLGRTTYAMYEQGKREPDLETLKIIAKYHKVTIDYLIGHKSEDELKEADFQAFANDPELQTWYKELPKSNEDKIRKLRLIWEMIENDRKN